MPNYKQMYFDLVERVSAAIDVLSAAKRAGELEIIDEETPEQSN